MFLDEINTAAQDKGNSQVKGVGFFQITQQMNEEWVFCSAFNQGFRQATQVTYWGNVRWCGSFPNVIGLVWDHIPHTQLDIWYISRISGNEVKV